MSISPRTAIAAFTLLAVGALAGQALGPRAASVFAENRPGDRKAFMEVINYSKTNEPAVFVYDEETRRLLMYMTTSDGKGPELKLIAARNTAYDLRIEEYKNANEKGMSVGELKRAFAEEDAKERAATQKKAEEEAKKKKKENG
jgi:hypothetical protein